MMRGLSTVVFLVILSVPSSNSDGQSAFTLETWSKQEYTFKLALVKAVINVAQKDNVAVRLPPEYYVKEIDQLIENIITNRNESALKSSTAVALKTIAVMDCDWDNGRDRLTFAHEFLGNARFSSFRKDYPEKYQKLAQGCR
jgi:hypothetical protein